MAYSRQKASLPLVRERLTDHPARAVAMVATPTLELLRSQREPPEDWPNGGPSGGLNWWMDGSSMFLVGLVAIAAYAECLYNSLSPLLP